MGAVMWDIQPGDKVGLDTGESGWVDAVCTFCGIQIGLKVGFEWYGIEAVVSWLPQER